MLQFFPEDTSENTIIMMALNNKQLISILIIYKQTIRNKIT